MDCKVYRLRLQDRPQNQRLQDMPQNHSYVIALHLLKQLQFLDFEREWIWQNGILNMLHNERLYLLHKPELYVNRSTCQLAQVFVKVKSSCTSVKCSSFIWINITLSKKHTNIWCQNGIMNGVIHSFVNAKENIQKVVLLGESIADGWRLIPSDKSWHPSVA